MKRIYLLYILFFLIAPIFSQENFNYYMRKLDGSFVIANIEEDRRMNYFKYVLINENSESKIIGYYYKRDIVKFVDNIENNKIKSSKYFDEKNNLIYQMEYFYDDNRLTLMIANSQTVDFIFCSEIKIDYFENLIKMNTQRFIKNNTSMINIVTYQLLDCNFSQLYSETVLVKNKDNNTQSTKLIDIYKYNNTKLEAHKIYENKDEILIREYRYNENLSIIEEKEFDKGILISTKTISKENNFVNEKITIIPDFEIEMEYYIDEIATSLYLKYDDSDNFLVCEDESVSMNKISEKYIPANKYLMLHKKLDPFFEFPFLDNYLSKIMPVGEVCE